MRYEFVNQNMSMYMCKPLKIILEMKPVPHLVVVEDYSQMFPTLKYVTSEGARNLLIQMAYMFQRIIHLNSKDASIYRPLLGLHFDSETNLSIKDGKLKASAVDSIVFPK